MFGDNRLQQRPTFTFFLFVVVVALLESFDVLRQFHHPVEAFVSLDFPTKRIVNKRRSSGQQFANYVSSSSRLLPPQTFASSYHNSKFIPKMTSRHDNDNDNDTTNAAAPMYITIGKIIFFILFKLQLLFLFWCLGCLCFCVFFVSR